MKPCDNPQCGKNYEPKVPWQRFCSDKCHDDYHKQRVLTIDDVRRIATQVVKKELEIRAIRESSD